MGSLVATREVRNLSRMRERLSPQREQFKQLPFA